MPTILVMDDEPLIRNSVIDLVFSDVRMPGELDGFPARTRFATNAFQNVSRVSDTQNSSSTTKTRFPIKRIRVPRRS